MVTRRQELVELAEAAWAVRDQAYVLTGVKVGSAVLATSGNIHTGCNIEHRFRSHDVHAEVNAIATMIKDGDQEIDTIIVVAPRKQFTPCGACMDWILQFGRQDTKVAFQSSPEASFLEFEAVDLMPHYPE